MRDADVPSFSSLVQDGRKTKGWSQDELEAHSGVSRATISRIERGLTDTPDADHVRALCRSLNIDPRQAAVSLGYLTLDEIQPLAPLPPKIKEVLDILEDPRVSDTDKQQWIDYLVYLRARSKSATDAS
ncbi:transcriptional regulator with XRE-family HTH domain [Actinoplanes campanulatus]|uniref:Transcriptional regulator with XRE-family HTH domain n=1 Tax=Actinoplanes campanulatus TaxID=113559 RepID=A0A7W5AMS1_9ACTN|nr:helix-turn-helix transcriptional regulator [Actinoplanes campanulatus]MBB3098917.1 transcriptional regulator with XRE-family HTH domain [Actinoplanes campanulatus]